MTNPRLALWVLAAALPLLASCAGGSKGIVASQDVVEITNEQYTIDQVGANRYIDYKGTVKNWLLKDVYNVTVVYVGFDKAGKPAVSFKQRLADKLAANEEKKFTFRKSVVGTEFDKFKAQITYLDKKPNMMDSMAPAHLRDV